MRLISICLTDIPRDKIWRNENNNKKYIRLVVNDRPVPDRFGHTVSVHISQTEEERAVRAKRIYVGSGYEST